jgi:hypothetical protein
MRIGVYSSSTSTSTNSRSTIDFDHYRTTQWKARKKQPRPLGDASNKFGQDLKNFNFEKQKLLVVHTPTLANTDVPPPLQPIFEKNANLKMDLIKAFLSKILASPNVMQDPSFFKHDIGSSTIAELLQQTAVEIEEKKAEDKKIDEAVSAAS